MNQEVNGLHEQAKTVGEDKKAQLDENLEKLDLFMDEAKLRLREFAVDSSHAWDDVKVEATKSWDALKTGIDKILSNYRK